MHFTVTGRRLDEASTIQPFDELAQAVSISPQHFNHVTLSTADDKDLPGELMPIS